MAAGDLINADYQAELRTTLMGPTSNYPITGIAGISVADIVKYDLPKLLADGVFQGSHFYASRVVTLTMNVVGTTEANLQSRMDTLETAWAKSTSDIYFVLRLPTWGKKRLAGRPIRFDRPEFTPEQVAAKTVRGVRAQFEAGDPTWTAI